LLPPPFLLINKENEMPLYRNLTMRRFRIGPFEFSNHLAHVSEEDNAMFLQLVAQLPNRVLVNIVEVNEEAAAKLTRPVQITRGASGADGLQETSEARDRILAQESLRNKVLSDKPVEKLSTNSSDTKTAKLQ